MNAQAAKKSSKTKAARRQAAPRVAINRRREWRFDLPLLARVEGKNPQGQAFKETSTLQNISSTGAYFCLDSGLAVGAKLNLVIEIPREATDGRPTRLRVGGITVRLEKPDRKGKRQGVAVRFSKDFKFVSGRSAK